MADTATATPTKKKINRTPLAYELIEVRVNENGLKTYHPVPQPDLGDKKSPTRNDYKRAVRKSLEKGENAEHYNGKQLTVISYPEPFCFNATIETVEVRKVKINES
jgi:hypothetical protein